MKELNIREIEMFLAVAKNQNISRTAEELYISQSALSSWISRMEDYCGVKLFRRTNRGVVLTAEGEDLYARLDIAYRRFKVSAEEIFGTYTSERKSDLRIGCLSRLATLKAMNSCIDKLTAAFPEKRIYGERFNFHELRDRLLCEELDLAVSISSDIECFPEFETLSLGKYPLCFIVKKGVKELDRLNGSTLIVEAPTNRAWAEKVCLDNEITPGKVRYVNSYILLETLVAAGEGFAIDGEMIRQEDYVPKTDWIPVETSAEVDVVLAWKKERKWVEGCFIPSIFFRD